MERTSAVIKAGRTIKFFPQCICFLTMLERFEDARAAFLGKMSQCLSSSLILVSYKGKSIEFGKFRLFFAPTTTMSGYMESLDSF